MTLKMTDEQMIQLLRVVEAPFELVTFERFKDAKLMKPDSTSDKLGDGYGLVDKMESKDSPRRAWVILLNKPGSRSLANKGNI